MHSTGVEPVTLGSEDRCSIQLSYECDWPITSDSVDYGAFFRESQWALCDRFTVCRVCVCVAWGRAGVWG